MAKVIGLTSTDLSNPKPMPRIFNYLSSSKKSFEGRGAKGGKTLLSPALERSLSNSESSLPMRVRKTSQESDLGLTPPNGEPDAPPTRTGDLQDQHITEVMQGGPTIPRESPLKRPFEPGATAEPVEEPLQRPFNSSEEILYSDVVVTFAVDVSGSTAGKVLEEEKEAIKTLCSGLSRDAFTQADIIPWNHDVQALVRGDRLETLVSSGGTNPSQLNISQISKMALSKCSAWFLLTDGEIDHKETEGFSKGIRDASLHGTPCVVVLFGYKTARPVRCNISVGLSVFSNAADCLFLFHDIDTTQVYILQSKGVFNAFLPHGLHELILDSKTLWTDVPLFKYRQLFDLPLPTRQNLRPDDLLLQGRHKINLQDLYQNHIDSSIASEILSNNDNLQSILLAAQLRGDDDRIRNWVSEQEIRAKNILLCERPDVGHQAFNSMRALLSILVNTTPDGRITALQHDLRIAHHKNWVEFVSSIGIEYDERSARSTVVSDVIERISTNRKEMDTGTHSPNILNPVSPSPRRRYQGTSSPSRNDSQHSYKKRPPPTPRLRRMRVCEESAAMAPIQTDPRDPYRDLINRSSIPALKLRLEGENAGALYIQNYKYRPQCSADGFEGTCPICEEEKVLLVLLLKSPPADISTPNFPQPNDRKGLAYPLAMGTYPETDILSSQISCDSCAYTLIQGEIVWGGDEVTAAIPIMKAAFSGEYHSTTLNLIDTALENRFQKSSIELVFLSILYSTLANLDNTNFELALKTACSWIVRKTRLPPCLSVSINGSMPQSSIYGDPMPMVQVLKENVQNVQRPGPPLLRYPVGGFVVLMLIITDLPSVASVKACQLAVWHRFLFHLVEKHCALLAANQSQAVLALQKIFQVRLSDTDIQGGSDTDMEFGDDPNAKSIFEMTSESGKEDERPDWLPDVSMDSPVPPQPQLMPSVRLNTICGTHLLSEEDLEEFQHLGDLFEPIELLCSTTLDSFLKCLLQQVITPSLAVEIFDKMRAQKDLYEVFLVPEDY